jgi:hypothetical protein
MLNEHKYIMGYYLSDGIYPEWAIFCEANVKPPRYKECSLLYNASCAWKRCGTSLWGFAISVSHCARTGKVLG